VRWWHNQRVGNGRTNHLSPSRDTAPRSHSHVREGRKNPHYPPPIHPPILSLSSTPHPPLLHSSLAMAVTRLAVAAALSAAPPSSRRRRAFFHHSCRPLPSSAAAAAKALRASAAPAVDEEAPASPPPSGARALALYCSRFFFRLDCSECSVRAVRARLHLI
jgi:hypothetical protein